MAGKLVLDIMRVCESERSKMAMACKRKKGGGWSTGRRGKKKNHVHPMLSCWKHKKKTNSAALVKKGERESKRHAKGRVKRLGGKGEMLRIYPGVALSSNSSSIKETRMSDQDWDLGGNLVKETIF